MKWLDILLLFLVTEVGQEWENALYWGSYNDELGYSDNLCVLSESSSSGSVLVAIWLKLLGCELAPKLVTLYSKRKGMCL